jgi:hypothetical protein
MGPIIPRARDRLARILIYKVIRREGDKERDPPIY